MCIQCVFLSSCLLKWFSGANIDNHISSRSKQICIYSSEVVSGCVESEIFFMSQLVLISFQTNVLKVDYITEFVSARLRGNF